jgi:hypothetical protein
LSLGQFLAKRGGSAIASRGRALNPDMSNNHLDDHAMSVGTRNRV